MASRSLGTLSLDLIARIGGYEQGLQKAEREAQKRAAAIEKAFDNTFSAITAGFAGLAAAGTAALAAINAQAETIANFQDLSDKIGDTAQNIATLQQASTISGVALDSVAAASIKLTAALSKTDDEGKAVGQALKDIGLGFEDFKRLSPVEQIDAVAKALDGFEDGAGKTAIAVSLFGKSGAEILPFLKDLAEQGERQVGLTKEQIAAADDYTKATARLKAEFDGFIQQQSASYIPVLSQVQSILAEVAKNEDVVTAATTAVKVAVDAAVVVLQTLLVVGSDIVFVFKGVGREIGAVAAQAAALARLDFTGFNAISDAVKEDGARARKELDAFQARVMKIGQTPYMDDEIRRLQARSASANVKPILRATPLATGGGGGRKGADTAAQEAAAQLSADLDAIKNAQAALVNTYSNQQRIMEALRSAGLLDERAYFSEKLQLLNQTIAAQEDGARAEIARLQQENLTGKAGIDNLKKIADAQAKLNKIQEDGRTSVRVLGIESESAYTKTKSALLAARQAAEDFYNTTAQGLERQVQGLGQGSKFREFLSGLQQVEDSYARQRRDLANQRAQAELIAPLTAQAREEYEQRLAIINEFGAKAVESYKSTYSKIEAASKDWTVGAGEALRNYADNAKNISKGVEDVVGNAFRGLEDALVEFTKTGKLNFKSLADSIIADIARIVIRAQITGPLAEWLNGSLKGASSGGGGLDLGSLLSSLFGGARAMGGPVSPEKLYRVNENGPEMFVARNGDQMLLTGSQGGTIIPNHKLGGGFTMVNNFAFQGKVDRRTETQVAMEVRRQTNVASSRLGSR